MGTHDDTIHPPGSVTTITNSVRACMTRTSVCFTFLMFDVPSACARMQTEPRVHAHAQFVTAPDELRHLWKSELHVRQVLKKSTVHAFCKQQNISKELWCFSFHASSGSDDSPDFVLRSQERTRQGRARPALSRKPATLAVGPPAGG